MPYPSQAVELTATSATPWYFTEFLVKANSHSPSLLGPTMHTELAPALAQTLTLTLMSPGYDETPDPNKNSISLLI